jgi:hypothetical protein
MRVRSCWSGAEAEAPTAAAQREVVPPIVEERSPVEERSLVGARSFEAERSFEEEQS